VGRPSDGGPARPELLTDTTHRQLVIACAVARQHEEQALREVTVLRRIVFVTSLLSVVSMTAALATVIWGI
jgi:hypothetical protein